MHPGRRRTWRWVARASGGGRRGASEPTSSARAPHLVAKNEASNEPIVEHLPVGPIHFPPIPPGATLSKAKERGHSRFEPFGKARCQPPRFACGRLWTERKGEESTASTRRMSALCSGVRLHGLGMKSMKEGASASLLGCEH